MGAAAHPLVIIPCVHIASRSPAAVDRRYPSSNVWYHVAVTRAQGGLH